MKKKIDKNYFELKSIKCQNYITKYIPAPTEYFDFKNFSVTKLPIWQLWLQGEEKAPSVVKSCLASVKKYSDDRPVYVLDLENYSNYINLPNFILEKYKKGIISSAQFSDIIRLYLLEKYGGTWIDATVMLSGVIQKNITNSNFFGFCIPENGMYQDYHLTSSWFIHSVPNHPFIADLKKSMLNYWSVEDKLIHYFLFHFFLYKIVTSNYLYYSEWKKTPKIDNRAPHSLQMAFYKKFDRKLLSEFLKKSSIHKLTYKFKDYPEGCLLDYLVRNDYLLE